MTTSAIDTAVFTLPGPEEDGNTTFSFVRWRPKPSSTKVVPNSARRIALFAFHAVGSHKEAWLTTAEELFMYQEAEPTSNFVVEEFWATDCPNHGQSAVTNAVRFKDDADGITAPQWARGAHKLIRSGLISPEASLVGIGHSAGVAGMVFLLLGYPHHKLPCTSVVLVEPPMMTREIHARFVESGVNLMRAMEGIKRRKDIWDSRAAAHEWLAQRVPWKMWDARVLQAYVDYALCDLPTATYPDHTSGVTLTTPRASEYAGYLYWNDGFMTLEMLKDLCPVLPVHTIFGERKDMIPEFVQHAIVGAGTDRRMASVEIVADAGHLLVQDNPKGLARAIWATLEQDYGRARGKL